jgi:uncharacterized protein YyaL (SSP411 family)
LLALALSACASRGTPARTPAPVESAAPREPLAWADLDAETFARAKREQRFIVLDGSAEWCHWCHVMEATTYHDEAVQEILRAKFIAVKVDVDARPDIEERYGDWGWPATVIFSPDGEELGKYKGYIEPERFVEILRDVARGDARAAAAETTNVPSAPLTEDELATIAHAAEKQLEDYWDTNEGGWGHAQKAPLAWDNAWALERGKTNAEARARAVLTLGRQRALLDPVWGGVYQYSAAADWKHPHFEKLTPVQAGAIDNYAAAWMLTKDPAMLDAARAVQRYLDRFMTSPEGGFYATEDADLNAHERGKPFMDGHAYYAKNDAERSALGVPRIDTHEYARENGLVIAAYATLFEATRDAAVIAAAKKAAVRILTSHTSPSGGITHDVAEGSTKPIFLADNAAMAWGLVRLYEATGEREWLDGATRVLEWTKTLADGGGGFFASTPDTHAVGVFAKRRKPFEENVLALRAIARVARATSSEAAWRPFVAGALRAIATPARVHDRGRMLGDFLLAMEETRSVR